MVDGQKKMKKMDGWIDGWIEKIYEKKDGWLDG